MLRLLTLAAGSCCLVLPAAAQLAIGTTQGSNQTWPNYLYNFDNDLVLSEAWTDAEPEGLAYDEATQTMYILDGNDLFRMPLSDLGGPLDPAIYMGTVSLPTGNWQGLAYRDGYLYVSSDNRLRRILISTLFSAPVMDLHPEADVNALAFDRRTGLLYAANNGTGFDDGQGGMGSGILEIDLSQQSVRLIAPYQGPANNVHGLAMDPFGVLYLVRDVSGKIRRYDLDAGSYLPGSPNNSLPFGPPTGAVGVTWVQGANGLLGTPYCDANPNTTGQVAQLRALGSPRVAANLLRLEASKMPSQVLCVFLTSTSQGFVPHPSGSQGNLCLTSFGRFVASGQPQVSSGSGAAQLMIDLGQLPLPSGFTSAMGGQTWNFQAWYRDWSGGAATSNFTHGLAVPFD